MKRTIKQAFKRTVCTVLTLMMLATLFPISSVSAEAKNVYPEMLNLIGATIRYTDKMGNTEGKNASGLRIAAVIDKQSDAYKKAVPDGTYDPANKTVKFGMWIIPTDLVKGNAVVTNYTNGVLEVDMKTIYAQDDNEIHFTVSLLGIPEEDYDRDFTIRLYMKTYTDGKWKYTPSISRIVRNCVDVANDFCYDNRDNDALCDRLDALFSGNGQYQGRNMEVLTFALLADLHYKEGLYMSSVGDLQTILDRANKAGADFIMQMGDFCNDWQGSPELIKAYLQNNYNMPAYGIYGNHELESAGNSMQVVTPQLNNREVVWGTADGKIGDGSIAYFYYDVGGFRVVCTDTNYSYNPTTLQWEHNKTASWGAPTGNTLEHSFGPTQLEWIETVLTDAANKSLRCVFISHASVNSSWSPSPDTSKVQAIFSRVNAMKKGTVMMAINGHLHTNHIEMRDNVLYLDMNTVRNGFWKGNQTDHHYTNQMFPSVKYDTNGNPILSQKIRVNTLSQAKNTWFFEDPLSTIVRITSTGKITVESMTTTWFGNVVPEGTSAAAAPIVSGGVWKLDLY